MKRCMLVFAVVLACLPARAFDYAFEDVVIQPLGPSDLDLERTGILTQIGLDVQILQNRARKEDGPAKDDADAQRRKERKAVFEKGATQLLWHQRNSQVEPSAPLCGFAKLEQGAIGRACSTEARVMQVVDENSVLVETEFVRGKSQAALVRGIKSANLVDSVQLKGMLHVCGTHKYKSGGREVEAVIVEPFDSRSYPERWPAKIEYDEPLPP